MSETLKKQAMARAISENNSRELWQEVKKMRKYKCKKSYCIEIAIGEHNIGSLFANKYEELYNSVRNDEQSFSSIISENTYDIKSQCIEPDVDSYCDIIHTHSITVYIYITFSIYMDKLIKQLRNSNIGCKIVNQYVGVFCYVDDISLLCPSITGLKQMLLLCETHAEEHNIRFNSSKSHLIHFTDKKRVTMDISIEMKNGSKIKMVDKCKYIGTTLYSDVKFKHIPDVDRYLTVSLNNLFGDFSFVDSLTLSRLFDSYCMNLYGSQLFRYNDIKSMELLYVTWRKSIRKIWKISPRSHCNLLHHINSYDPIDNIMEKRCIQFIWNLMNNDIILFDRTVKHSLSMSRTTLGENILYLMFKYGIYMSEWYRPLSVLYGKIQKHILKETFIINKCTSIAIRDICNARDSNVFIMPDNEYISTIDILCTE